LIDIYKNKPPKNNYIPLKRYQNVVFIKKYNIDIVESFFKKFPEEKRGRKKFKEKEIQNIKNLIYEKIFQKGIKIKAHCIGSIKEKVDKELIIIKVSFFKKNE
tara:strand:+ start:54 stop:362 length:309 start_codon:yes stop_codon:yes gene_type:complete